jgi:GAF domain-containing protein
VLRKTGSALLQDHGVVSGMSVVIETKSDQVWSTKPLKRPFGILGAHSNRRGKFSLSNVDFLQAVAHILATAIAEQQSAQALAEESNFLLPGTSYQLRINILNLVDILLDLKVRGFPESLLRFPLSTTRLT